MSDKLDKIIEMLGDVREKQGATGEGLKQLRLDQAVHAQRNEDMYTDMSARMRRLEGHVTDPNAHPERPLKALVAQEKSVDMEVEVATNKKTLHDHIETFDWGKWLPIGLAFVAVLISFAQTWRVTMTRVEAAPTVVVSQPPVLDPRDDRRRPRRERGETHP